MCEKKAGEPGWGWRALGALGRSRQGSPATFLFLLRGCHRGLTSSGPSGSWNLCRERENHEPLGLPESAGLYSTSRDEELKHRRVGRELLREV